MRFDFFAAGDDYFMAAPSASVAVRWHLSETSVSGENWTYARSTLPDGAEEVSFAGLPAALQEEVLAFGARAEGMAEEFWSADS